MKKILVILWVFILWCISAFAYTPSSDLVERMDIVLEKFEDIIDEKWVTYKSAILSTLDIYSDRYSDDERVSYILGYLYDNIKNYEISASSGVIISNLSWDYTGEYSISDSTYGTQVEVNISNGVRTITSNAIANHETWEFPNAGNPNEITEQDKTWQLTTTPTYVWNETWARENGVAYNGVKYELQTAESVSCESGEVYRIEAIQTAFNLGLDDNNAHVQPTGEYHYHGVADVLMNTLEWDDVVHVGYANDGFPIMYSKLGTYTPSFSLSTDEREGISCTYRGADVVVQGTSADGTYGEDYDYIEGLGNLDACNGTYLDGEYVYFVTEDFPFGPRCLNGEVSGGQWGPQWGQGGPGGQQGWQWGPQWGERAGPPEGNRPPQR